MNEIYFKIELFKNNSFTCYRSIFKVKERHVGNKVSYLNNIDDAIKTAKIVLNKFNCDFALIFDNVSEKNASKELRETQDNAIRVNKVEQYTLFILFIFMYIFECCNSNTYLSRYTSNTYLSRTACQIARLIV